MSNHPPETNHAGTDTQGSTNDACFPRTLCVLFPLLPSHPSVKNTEQSKANMRTLGHPKYPFPGSKEPLVLPPDVYEHSVSWIFFSSHYKDPTTYPTYVLPSILCSFTSESAAQPHCLLLGAESLVQSCSFPSCLSGQDLDGGRPRSPHDYRAQEDFVRGLALERCSDFTAKQDLLCRDNLSSPSSLPPPGLTGSWDFWSRSCWSVKGSLPFQIAFQEDRNCNLQSARFLCPKVIPCVCVPVYVPHSLEKEPCLGQTTLGH